MNIHAAYATDIGNVRHENQDSLSLQALKTEHGEAVLAAVCDGMGGYQQGEIASALVTETLRSWFRNRLPMLLKEGLLQTEVGREWISLIKDCDREISRYAAEKNIRMGTTVSAFLSAGGKYYLLNVGDTRIYRLQGSEIQRMTRDHTLVEREVEKGMLTLQQADQDPRQNILLQCVGAGKKIRPDIYGGTLRGDCVWFLCSDGLRHQAGDPEFAQYLSPSILPDSGLYHRNLLRLISMCRDRGEEDNLSGIVIGFDNRENRTGDTILSGGRKHAAAKDNGVESGHGDLEKDGKMDFLAVHVDKQAIEQD